MVSAFLGSAVEISDGLQTRSELKELPEQELAHLTGEILRLRYDHFPATRNTPWRFSVACVA